MIKKILIIVGILGLVALMAVMGYTVWRTMQPQSTVTRPKATAGAGQCLPPSQTHFECVSNSCVRKIGVGSNQGGCTTAGASCGGQTYYSCQNKTCAIVSGATANANGCTAAGGTCCAGASDCSGGQTCDITKIPNSCVSSATCNATSCPSGCCSGTTCVAYASQTASSCGMGGAACSACTAGQTCSNGVCTSVNPIISSTMVNQSFEPWLVLVWWGGGNLTSAIKAQLFDVGGTRWGGDMATAIGFAPPYQYFTFQLLADSPPSGCNATATCSGVTVRALDTSTGLLSNSLPIVLPIAPCPSGQTACGGVCKNLSTDPANCGACGTVCNSTNGTAACTNSACTITCSSGYGNCDSNAANGCEIPLNTTSNCGACGNVCSSGQNCDTSKSPSQCVTQKVVCDSLTVSPTTGNAPLSVVETLVGHTVNGGSITGYKFVNEGKTTAQSATTFNYTFNNPGTATVSGYVVDNNGNADGGSGACATTISVTCINDSQCPSGQICKSGFCSVPDEVNTCWGNGGVGTNAGRCYDCNGDGVVNILDFSCFRLNWLKPVQ